MTQRGIPSKVQQFIRDHLTSVAQLEILLLMHGDPDLERTPGEVAERLRIDSSWAGSELRGLEQKGVLRSTGEDAYCFDPASPEKREAVDGLAKAFATHRVSVITLIFSTPSDSIGSFADAFKLRSDDDG